MNALIFAAGRGERLKPLTEHLAKPAIPFLNIPMMAFPMFYLEQANLKTMALNTHHLPKTIQETAEKIKLKNSKLIFSPEPQEILGSGGGVAQAIAEARRLGHEPADPLVVINGDLVALFESPQIISKVLEFHRQNQARATLVVCPFPEAQESFGGVYVNQNSEVKKFSKTPLSQGDLKSWHFTGILVLSRATSETLKPVPSNLLYETLQTEIDQGHKIMAYQTSSVAWYETGNLKDYLASTQKALELLAQPSSLQRTLIQILDRFSPGWWKGWKASSKGNLLCAFPGPEKLQVDEFAVVSAESFLGREVKLKRAVLLGSCALEDHVTVENKVLFSQEIKSSGRA